MDYMRHEDICEDSDSGIHLLLVSVTSTTALQKPTDGDLEEVG